jgi:hypothetical protein
MTLFQCRFGQHNISTMEKCRVYCIANGAICGTDMLVLEGTI